MLTCAAQPVMVQQKQVQQLAQYACLLPMALCSTIRNFHPVALQYSGRAFVAGDRVQLLQSGRTVLEVGATSAAKCN